MHRLAFVVIAFTTGCLPALEGSPQDPPIDPPPVEPTPPEPAVEVGVRVADAGIGVSGLNVIFQTADDTVIAERVTDAAGLATADMPQGGSVTIIRNTLEEGQARTTAFTYTGVKPGDLLELTSPTARGTAPVTVQLAVPTPDPEEGLGIYTVITPCGANVGIAPTIEIQLDGCGIETDFFVVDETGGAFLAHRTIAPTIDLSTEVVRQHRDTTLRALNAPANIGIALDKRLVAGGFPLFQSTQTSPDVTVPVPDIGATAADQLVVARLEGAGISQRVASREPYNNNTATIDLADMLVPTIESALFDGTAIAWVESTTGTRDFAIATLADGSMTRVLAGSTIDPALRLPVLPSSYGITVGPEASLSLTVGKVTGGYDEIRGRIHGRLLDATPMNGRLATSTLGQ